MVAHVSRSGVPSTTVGIACRPTDGSELHTMGGCWTDVQGRMNMQCYSARCHVRRHASLERVLFELMSCCYSLPRCVDLGALAHAVSCVVQSLQGRLSSREPLLLSRPWPLASVRLRHAAIGSVPRGAGQAAALQCGAIRARKAEGDGALSPTR